MIGIPEGTREIAGETRLLSMGLSRLALEVAMLSVNGRVHHRGMEAEARMAESHSGQCTYASKAFSVRWYSGHAQVCTKFGVLSYREA